MRINQNIMAFNAYRNLSATNDVLGKSLEKLSSGFRINRAADDAAGLVISEGLRAQVSGLRMATRNAQDGVSVVQTAEGALTEVHSMLRRMRDLVLQASNTGASDSAARNAAQTEIDQLSAEIDRVADTTKFGSTLLLDGNYGGAVSATEAAIATATGMVAGDQNQTGNTVSFLLSVDGDSYVTVDVTGADWTNAPATLQTALNTALDAAGVASGLWAAGEVSAGVTQTGAGAPLVTTLTRNSTAEGTSIAVTAAPGNSGLADLGFTSGQNDDVDITGGGGRFQVGTGATEAITVAISAMSADALNVESTDVVVNGTDAQRTTALSNIDAAIASVSTQRGNLGAYQNRFEHTIANLSVTAENLAASESRIRDTDMALELVSFTRHQILQQAGTAMLAQANQVPQSVLSLLG